MRVIGCLGADRRIDSRGGRGLLGFQGRELGPQLGIEPLILADLLAVEDQGEELARRDATTAIAGREQQTVMDFPAIPADPGHEAGEDGQEPDGGWIGLARGSPAPPGA